MSAPMAAFGLVIVAVAFLALFGEVELYWPALRALLWRWGKAAFWWACLLIGVWLTVLGLTGGGR